MESATPGAERLKTVIGPVVSSLGCELWDAAITGPRGRRMLRVYIDAPGGVDLDDCVRVSRSLGPALAAAGVAMDDVDLEVSSPGAERRLRGLEDYRRFAGQRVRLRYRSGEESEGVVEGTLTHVDEASLAVADRDGRPHPVSLQAVVEVRLAVEFGAPERPRKRT
jgi:ribosome maturation factor RimP